MENSAYYYRIKELMIPNPAPESIEKNINTYIDSIDESGKRLEECFNKMNFVDFKFQLQKVQDMLRSVYAKRFEADGYTLLRASEKAFGKVESIENCREMLRSFVAGLHSLSIEMQKAQNLKGAHFEYTEAEKYGESANNLSAISKLIGTGNYDKAQNLVSDMQRKSFVNKDDTVLIQLGTALSAREYDKADTLASTKKNEYMGYIVQAGGLSGTTRNVLAVDDRPEILSVVNSALSDYFKVFVAPGGSEALKIMQQHRIDLFILDIEMPSMDGFELTERIRAIESYASTPIMFFTTHSSRESIKKSMELGISDFIVKPSYPETLLVKSAKYFS